MSLARGRAMARPHSIATACLLAALLALALAGCGGSATSTRNSPRVPRSPTPIPPVIYVAIGASDAVGVGADDPNTQGYVPLLIARLPAHSQALNLGINGNVVHSALTNELPAAIADRPTLVTVWMVGNDFRGCTPLDQYRADLNTLLAQLQSQTHARVFVANLPDMSQLPFFQNGAPQAAACLQGQTTAQIRAQVVRWNVAIAAVAAQHGAVLVDLFSSSLAGHPDLVSRDGFHPSSAGYKVLADLFWSQIQAHGGVPSR